MAGGADGRFAGVSALGLAYVERQMDIEEGVRFVREKLKRSYSL